MSCIISDMNTQTPHPILYSFRRCPYAMRARLGIKTSGLKVELREVVLRDKPDHMLEISPKGTVPVLLTPTGDVIEESLEIMVYALGRHDPDEWLGADEQQTQNLIKQNDSDFKYALDRYKYPNRYPDEDCSDMFNTALEILKDWNERIKANKGHLVESYDTLADFAIFPFVRQFAHVDKNKFYDSNIPELQSWLKRHLQSDIFKSIMPKFDQWQKGDEPLFWP